MTKNGKFSIVKILVHVWKFKMNCHFITKSRYDEWKKEGRNSKMPKFNQFKNRNKLITWYLLWGICWTLHQNIYGGFKNWSQTTSFLFLSKWKMKKQFWKMSDWEFLLSRTFIFRSVMLSCFALVQGFFS